MDPQLIERVEQLLAAGGWVLGIAGAPGAGKSTLAESIVDSFDVDGYVAALRRVRDRRHDVLAPRFHREIEEPVANAIRVSVETQLVVTEGNYLTLDRLPWSQVGPLLDECWMLDPDDDVRRARLIARHEAHGRTHDEAVRWVHAVDEPNAVLVQSTRDRADLVIH